MAQEVGEYLPHLSPAPDFPTLLCVYGALFLGVAKALGADPAAALNYIDLRYSTAVQKTVSH